MKKTFQKTTLAEVPDVRLTPFLEEAVDPPAGSASS
jgi:hypothetical protein